MCTWLQKSFTTLPENLKDRSHYARIRASGPDLAGGGLGPSSHWVTKWVNVKA